VPMHSGRDVGDSVCLSAWASASFCVSAEPTTDKGPSANKPASKYENKEVKSQYAPRNKMLFVGVGTGLYNGKN